MKKPVQRRLFPLLLTALGMVTPLISTATPSWMGVYGNFKHVYDTENATVFSVMLNQDYPGLHVEVGIQIDRGEWTVYPMWRGGRNHIDTQWNFTYPEALPAGSTVRYYYHAWDDWGFHMWDNNEGADYEFLSTPTQPVQWVGHTHDNAENGYHLRGGVLIHSSSWPAGAGTSAYVIYTHDGADGWFASPLHYRGKAYNNDTWATGLDAFRLGHWIEYAIVTFDEFGNAVWDNNHGQNYRRYSLGY